MVDPGSLKFEEKFLERWKEANIILITHKHGDHIHKDILENLNIPIYATREVQNAYPTISFHIIKENDILTFDNKYMGNSSAGMANLKRIIPADVSAEIAEEVKQTALKIFNSLSLKGVVRFDFIVDNKTNKVYVNELNTIPGSLAFYLFNPIDITYKQLINKLIKFAYIAHDNEQKLIKTFNSSVLDKTNIGSGLKK